MGRRISGPSLNLPVEGRRLPFRKGDGAGMDCNGLSASSAGCFRDCPLKYYAAYVLKMKDESPHPAAIIGQAAHKVMEEIAKTRCAPNIASVCSGFGLSSDKDVREVRSLVKNALSLGYLGNMGKNVGIEQYFRVPLGNGVPLTGIIDRLDVDEQSRSAVIHDLKTGKKAYTRAELKDNLQSKIYNVAVRKMHPSVETVDVIFWFVRPKERKMVSFGPAATERDERMLEGIAEEIVKTVEPVPRRNRWCRWCLYRSRCPEQAGIGQ